MIKLFRLLRQRVLSENRLISPNIPVALWSDKTGRYLIYALGEIALVMIGILLALQVNNWNEYRKERIAERTILTNIKNALISDIANTFKVQIERAENILITAQNIIEVSENQNRPKDSIEYAYLIYVRPFLPMTIPYKFLESKGFDVIINEKLKFAVSKLYDLSYATIEDMLNNNEETIYSYIRPYVREKFRISTHNNNRLIGMYTPFDYSEVFKDPQFLNIAASLTIQNNILLNFLKETESEVKDLITMIEKELQNS